jgi:hypothetical protein
LAWLAVVASLALLDSTVRHILQSLEFYTSFSRLVNSQPFFFPLPARPARLHLPTQQSHGL